LTAIAAIVLVAIALGIISRPLLTRTTAGRSRAGVVVLPELEERYRSALADIQDAQNDWEIGNLSESDYARFRDDGRRRAAEALRDITGVAEQREQLRGNVARELAALRASPMVTAAPAPANGRAQSASRSVPGSSARRMPKPYIIGGTVLTGLAVVGIVVLYVRAIGVQEAQAPVGAIPPPVPRAALVDAGGGYWAAQSTGLMQSADGHSWRSAGPIADLRAIVARDGRPWLALGPTSVVMSPDGGATWTALASPPPGTDLGGAQATTDGVYAYVGGVGIVRSMDGEGWEQIAGPVPERVNGLAVLPGQQGGLAIYLAAGGRVIRTGDGGRTWSAASGAVNLALTGSVRSIAADASRGALYAATSDGIFKTTRDGTDWERLPFRGSVSAISARGDRLIAIDDSGHVFVSNSGGVAWTADR